MLATADTAGLQGANYKIILNMLSDLKEVSSHFDTFHSIVSDAQAVAADFDGLDEWLDIVGEAGQPTTPLQAVSNNFEALASVKSALSATSFMIDSLTTKYSTVNQYTLRSYTEDYVNDSLSNIRDDLSDMKHVWRLSGHTDDSIANLIYNIPARGYSLSGLSLEEVEVDTSENRIQITYRTRVGTGDINEYTIILPKDEEMFIIPMQAIGPLGEQRLYGPYLITRDSVFTPVYETYADTGISTILTGFNERPLFTTKIIDASGFEQRVVDTTLFVDVPNQFSSNTFDDVVNNVSARDYYNFLTTSQMIPSADYTDYEYADINIIGTSYETIWYFQYFKQLEFHYGNYDDTDWAFAFYQVDGKYLDTYHPDEGVSFEGEIRKKYLEEDDDDEVIANTGYYHYHYSSLNHFTSYEEMYNTLLMFNIMKLREALSETMSGYIPVLYNTKDTGLFAGENSKVEDLSMGIMRASEFQVYKKVKLMEALDEDGSGSLVRNVMLQEDIMELNNLYADKVMERLNSKSVEQTVFDDISFNQYFASNSPLLLSYTPSELISMRTVYAGAGSHRVAIPGSGMLAAYYDANVDLYGRGISLRDTIIDELWSIYYDYKDVNLFHESLWRYAHKQLPDEMTDFFVERMQNLFKTGGRTISGWYDDLVQSVRHMIWGNNFIKLLGPLYYSSDFYSLIYVGPNTGTIPNSMNRQRLADML